ncbi:serine/threonine-protein kinase, partial [Frankia sp. AgKG'84/4]|uniref:serine/threonine-protein kinase n=1 Tax=Frankia sp. AgKG'84/4 TaxID=573490 RepID=UPI002029B5D9
MASESPDNVRPERVVALVGGRYRLDGVLGRGGFGVVHRATDELLQRVVAVKEVRLPISGNADERDRARERVLREARAAGRLQHPGAVSVLDVIDDGDLPWIIMEFVEGRALSRIITGQGPRPVDETCRIGISLAYALEAAHRLGIVHRDVKPSNVLITPDGRARLTDFGIAVSHGDPRLTSTGMVLGSPAYLPPERARGDAGGAGGDRWALGATLFTTVEGSPPFGGGDPIAVLGALMRGQRQPFRLAGPLAPLLDDLMAPQSTSRPPLSLVRRRLREILDHSGNHRSSRSSASTTRGSRSDRPLRMPAPPPPTSPEVTPSPAVTEMVAPLASPTTPMVAVHAPQQTAATSTARTDSAVLSPTDSPPADGADSPPPPLAALPGKPSATAEAATRDSQPESLATNDMNTAHTPPEPTGIATTHNTDDKRLSTRQHGAPVAAPPQSVEVTAVTKTPEEDAGSDGGECPVPAGAASTIASVALVEAAVIGATATLATAAALRVAGAGAGTSSAAAAVAEQPTEALPTGGPRLPEQGMSAAHLDQTPFDQATRSTSGATVEAGPAATTSGPADADADAENIDPHIDPEHPASEVSVPEVCDPAPTAAVHAEPARDPAPSAERIRCAGRPVGQDPRLPTVWPRRGSTAA